MFPEEIETDRLHLKRFCRENAAVLDVYPVCSMDSDTITEETEHLTWAPHETPKGTHDLLIEAEENWKAGEAATYAVYPRTGESGADEFAGVTGIHFEWDRRSAFTGLWLRKRFWGRGYSGERIVALLKLAFDRLDLDLVSPGHLDGNEQSKRAIEKYVHRFGGNYDGVLRNWVPIGEEVCDLHRYTITREQWIENRPDDAVTFHD